MARCFVDTSAIYALLDRDDDRHPQALQLFERVKADRGLPLVTNFIVGECHALLLARLGANFARWWLSSNVWTVERVTEADETRAVEIITGYVDKTFSYVDATSFAVMQRLRIHHALSFDRHFEQFGFQIN